VTDFIDLEKELSVAPRTRILSLVKVGAKPHLEELARGRLRFRSLAFYSDLESKGQAHHDGNEGLAGLFQSERIRIVLKAAGQEIEISKETGLVDQVVVREMRERTVLCLHAIHTGKWTDREFSEEEVPEAIRDIEIPKGMDRYGDHAWVITNGDAFKARLRAAVRREKLGLRAQLVRYVDFAAVHGRVPSELRGFVKNAADHADEREYRVAIDAATSLPDPYYLDVGDLSDISIIVPLKGMRLSLLPPDEGVRDGA
jgi:hypothetical protein